MGGDMHDRLFGEGNAYDGAQAVIAASKARGDWHDPEAKKAARFAAKPRKTAARVAELRAKVDPGAATYVAGVSTGRGKGIGAFCEALLEAGKPDDEVLAAALAQFPGAKTSPSSIAWYRNRLRKEGRLPK